MKRYGVLLFLFLPFFTACEHNPYLPQSPEALVAYMNSNYEGDFTLTGVNQIDNGNWKATEVFLLCSRFPDKTVYVQELWSFDNSFSSWHSYITTNYYTYVFADRMTSLMQEHLTLFFPNNKFFPCAGKICYSSKHPTTLDEYIAEHIWHEQLLLVNEPSSVYKVERFEELLYHYLTQNMFFFLSTIFFLEDDLTSITADMAGSDDFLKRCYAAYLFFRGDNFDYKSLLP